MVAGRAPSKASPSMMISKGLSPGHGPERHGGRLRNSPRLDCAWRAQRSDNRCVTLPRGPAVSRSRLLLILLCSLLPGLAACGLTRDDPLPPTGEPVPGALGPAAGDYRDLQRHTDPIMGEDRDREVRGRTVWFASTRHGENPDLYRQGVNGRSLVRLTTHPGSDRFPRLLASETEMTIGGDNVDQLLADWVVEQVLERHNWDLRPYSEVHMRLDNDVVSAYSGICSSTGDDPDWRDDFDAGEHWGNALTIWLR